MLKSMLFVPGDSEKKLAKASGSAASALILDLEDAVSIDRIEIGRGMVTEYLRGRADRARQQLWVRINPLPTPMSMPDLIAAVKGAADGILLPKVESGRDIVALDHYITALEQREVSRPAPSASWPSRPRRRRRCSRSTPIAMRRRALRD
jgi:citrate lyase subunit beta/citryl-CoA lyase